MQPRTALLVSLAATLILFAAIRSTAAPPEEPVPPTPPTDVDIEVTVEEAPQQAIDFFRPVETPTTRLPQPPNAQPTTLPEPPAQTEAQDAEQLTAEASAILKEILSIRQMFGDLLEGTDVQTSVLPETSAENSTTGSTFASELEKAISANEPARLPSCQQPLAATPYTSVYPQKVPQQSNEIVDMLRRMSRELDERANDLETQRRYTHADQLRSLAQQVRVQARTFESPGSTYSTSTPVQSQYNACLPLADTLEQYAHRSTHPRRAAGDSRLSACTLRHSNVRIGWPCWRSIVVTGHVDPREH